MANAAVTPAAGASAPLASVVPAIPADRLLLDDPLALLIGMLLDLHNLWANVQNLGVDAEAWLADPEPWPAWLDAPDAPDRRGDLQHDADFG